MGVVAACQTPGEAGGVPFDPAGTTGNPDGTAPPGGGTSDPLPPDDESTGSTPDDEDDGLPPPDDETTGGPGDNFDCSPQWTTPFVGSPCATDADCPYEGGTCIMDSQGFPCGTCSQPCEQFCPDADGTPETFCIDGSDVGLDAAGYCVSRCDPSLLGGDGCRDGYGCTALDRFMDSGTSTGVCVPQEFADEGDSDCQSQLIELGAVITPFDHTPESPAGHPGLSCTIEDAVLLYSPVNGVALRYALSENDSEVLVSCETALSIVGSAAVAQMLGVEEIIHVGTYNCRTIGGGNTLSQHGLAQAIDISGFTLESGEQVTVLGDWEDGDPTPETPFGILLRDFTDQVWGMGLWNIILTPEFNAAHDDHFHVDITPGGNTYD